MKRARVKKKVGQSSTMADLPSHILIEIISRLPIKTVVSIRCVCKSLLDIVSDSHFQTLYSTRAPTELLVSATCMSSKTLSIAECVFKDDSVTSVDTKSNVVFELPGFSVGCNNDCNFKATRGSIVSLVNSCCGLVCFKGPYQNKKSSVPRFAVICNPFTLEYVTLPCSAGYSVERPYVSYGLGFSPKDNKFKLVRLIQSEKESKMFGEIYTFGERSSWKRVANRPHTYLKKPVQEKVIFHGGALYWNCTMRGEPGGSIVTFDLDTELFGKLVTPPHEVNTPCNVGVFDNCLCISVCVGDRVFDVWALKEYGQGSWVKILSIKKDRILGDSYEPFKYLQNGEVLMFKIFGGIVCFNPDTRSVKNVDGISYSNPAVFIRPRLVSLKVLLGDNEEIHSVKPWDCKKAATVPRVWASSVTVKDVVKADKDSQGCVPGSSAPRSSSEASASTSHPTKVEEKVKEDVLPAILVSQQGGADVGGFGSQDPWPPKDRRAGQSSSETQKPVDEIETLKAEEQKSKVIEILNAKIDRQGKAIAKLKQRKRKDRAFMSFMYQQMLNMNPNIPACPVSDDSSSSDDSD